MVNLYGLESLGLRGLGVRVDSKSGLTARLCTAADEPKSARERERDRVEGSGFIVPLK